MSRQHGNTLLELLLVLALSGIIITLAIRYFAVVDLNSRVAQSISKIDILSRASYEWLSISRRGDFESISLDNLIDAELLRENDDKNPWGGDIEVSVGSNPQHVKIVFKDISAKACKNIRHHLKPMTYVEVSEESCKPDAISKQATYWGEF